MSEHQNIEYKRIWQDSYLKWISGFANANGGTLFIGVDDDGEVIGVEHYKELLEQLPNKFRDILGVFPQIKLLQKDNKKYIEIVIEPYSIPISYKGKYFVRSGSTLQELKGIGLNDFLFKKIGRSWDAEIESTASIDDLDLDTIERFKSLALSRLPSVQSESNVTSLLEKLNLIQDGKLKRASILLFGKNVQSFFLQAHVKIGLFSSDTEIISHDKIEGNLFQQVERTLEVLQAKYLLNTVFYEGIYRKEKLEIPLEALREAVINAIIHRSYLSNSSIQIKITNDTLEIMNENSPFNEIKVEELKANHLSKPVNLLLADTFYKAGLIESWGRGTIKIIEECKRQGLSEPEYSLNENHFSVLFHRPIEDVVEDVTKNVTKNVTKDVTKDVTENRIQQLLELIKDNDRISTYKLAQVIGVSRMTIMRDIEHLKSKGVLERIGPSQGGYWKIIK